MLILIGLFVVSCWKAPGPPWPVSGLEIVDFGEDFTGFGESTIITDAVVEEETPEETEPIEDPVVEPEPVDPDADNDPVETYDVDGTSTSTEVVESTATESEPVDVPNPDTQVPTNFGSNGGSEGPGDEGKENGTDSDKSEGGENGVIKIGGWTKLKEPDFKDDIKHGATMEFEFYVNELGQIEQIIWIHSSLTPSERAIIEKRLKNELKLKAKEGEKQKTKGTYKIDFQ
jgi:hypothetical protein